MSLEIQALLHALMSGSETVILAFFLRRFLGERFRRIWIYCVVYTFFFGGNLYISIFKTGMSVAPYFNIVMILCISLCFYKGTIFQTVFASGLFISYLFVTEVLSYILSSWITGYVFQVIPEPGLMFFITGFVAKILFCIIIIIVAKCKKEPLLPSPLSHRIVLLTIVAICTFLSFADMSLVLYSNNPTNLLNVLSETGIVVLCVTAFYVFEKFQQYINQQLQSSMLEQQISQSEHYLRRLDTVHKDMRSLKHDLTNHLVSMRQMLQTKDYDSLDEYISKYLDSISDVVSETITGMASVDGLISVKKQLAIDFGVRITVNTEMIERISVNPIHLNIVLSNVLDNAIEACAKLPPDNRYIEMNLSSGDTSIAKNTLPRTTKGDALHHGLGLAAVKKLVERYGGSVLVESCEGEFSFSARMESLKY